MTLLAAVDTNTLIGVGIAIGAGIAAWQQGRRAKIEARSAKQNAGDARDEAAAAKHEAHGARSAALTVVESFDPATLAGLLNQSNILLEQATTQLVRCESENQQLTALVKVLERRTDNNERELSALRAAVAAVEKSTTRSSARRTRQGDR